MKVKKFEGLKVWQLANKLSLEVSKLVKTFPHNEKYDLASQMHRSARSVTSEISEGFYRFHFNDKLAFYERARASLGELRNHFGDALSHKYINTKQYHGYRMKMQEISYLLNRMMTNIRKARETYDSRVDSRRSLTSIPKGSLPA